MGSPHSLHPATCFQRRIDATETKSLNLECRLSLSWRHFWLQMTVEAALADNEKVLSLRGAAEHIARCAPVTHPNMPENFLYKIEFLDLEEMQREADDGYSDED